MTLVKTDTTIIPAETGYYAVTPKGLEMIGEATGLEYTRVLAWAIITRWYEVDGNVRPYSRTWPVTLDPVTSDESNAVQAIKTPEGRIVFRGGWEMKDEEEALAAFNAGGKPWELPRFKLQWQQE